MVLLNSNVGKGLRSRMDEYFYIALETAKVLKLQLDALHRSNHSLPDCRLGSTRNSAINCLREKLVASMNSYNAMRQKISSEYREAVQRGGNLSAEGDPGAREMRSQVLATVQDLDTFKEFQERHDAVYLDMALLVESQDEQLRNESDEPKQRKTPATELRGVNNGKKKLRGVESYRENIRKWIALRLCCCC
ncbi:syntaxin-121 [Pyrus ussuriensis x Pyrus communis]|uniref:Syntaxin-121 n=1 Tax=Pyrus ussuriensis x Pyrus communis TaxID=2448454 RepID=A0A5N5FUZ9_9ROSA|nr:syntaxin-121 [Pyrus ussuriensis x Pyrus communis]